MKRTNPDAKYLYMDGKRLLSIAREWPDIADRLQPPHFDSTASIPMTPQHQDPRIAQDLTEHPELTAHPRILYDTLTISGGWKEVYFFSQPIGERDYHTLRQKTLEQTNLRRSHQLPPPEKLYIDRICFQFLSGSDNQAQAEMMEHSIWEFMIGQRIYMQAPISCLLQSAATEDILLLKCTHCSRLTKLAETCRGCGSGHLEPFMVAPTEVELSCGIRSTQFYFEFKPALLLPSQTCYSLQSSWYGPPRHGPVTLRAFLKGTMVT